jgi:hypothetical protein
MSHTCKCGYTGPKEMFTKRKENWYPDGHTNTCKKCHCASVRAKRKRDAKPKPPKTPKSVVKTRPHKSPYRILEDRCVSLERQLRDWHEEAVVRGKEIEKINRIYNLPSDEVNQAIKFKKIGRVLAKYERRTNCFSPSEKIKMRASGSTKNF